MINLFATARSIAFIALLYGCIFPGVGAASPRCAVAAPANFIWDQSFKGVATLSIDPGAQPLMLQADVYVLQFTTSRARNADFQRRLWEDDFEKSQIEIVLYNDDHSICHQFAIGFLDAGVLWKLSYRGDLYYNHKIWNETWFRFPQRSLDLSRSSIFLHGSYGEIFTDFGSFDLEAERLIDDQGDINWFESEMQLKSFAHLKISGGWVAGKPGWPALPLSFELERGVDFVSWPFRLAQYISVVIQPECKD